MYDFYITVSDPDRDKTEIAHNSGTQTIKIPLFWYI